MSLAQRLARPEIAALEPYRPARYSANAVRLNANEAPWRSGGDATARGLNRYPPHQPAELLTTLADLYGADVRRVLVTRGSSEAIDLLIRAFCRPYTDRIVVCPPTFAMYEVYARVQSAGVRYVPLQCAPDFQPDVEALLSDWRETDKILFLTSPNNPTGNRLADDRVQRLVDALAEKALVVIDAAYCEFGDGDDYAQRYADHPNVVVLRTLSKAMGLAGVRCGAVIAAPDISELLGRILAPYAFSTPCSDAALASLLADTPPTRAARIEALRAERSRIAQALARMPCVDEVYPSDANFLYVRFHDAGTVLQAALEAGLLLRDFSGEPGQRNCLRITIADEATNDRLLACLSAQGPAA